MSAIPGVHALRHALTTAALAAALLAASPAGAVAAGKPDGRPVVLTDARHAALVLHAGGRPRIAQPSIPADLDGIAVPAPAAEESGVAWIVAGVAAAAAVLSLGAATLVVGRRRKPRVA